jgi:hypothetical protein
MKDSLEGHIHPEVTGSRPQNARKQDFKQGCAESTPRRKGQNDMKIGINDLHSIGKHVAKSVLG